MPPSWHFWTSWQLDTGVTVAFILTAWVYLRGWLRLRNRGARRFGGWQLTAFFGGLITVWIALQSPIESFASLLLQMHMIQHVLLMFIAPPLIWMANPELPLLVGLPKWLRRSIAVPLIREPLVQAVGHLLTRPVFAWVLFVGTAWIWHLPRFYELALASQGWHEIEHAMFLFSALVFWRVVIAPYPSRSRLSRWILLPYLLFAGLQGTALSGLLTFSGRVIYPHYDAVLPLGSITALDDQAIAGALMWVLGSLAYLSALVWVAVQFWSDSAQPQIIGARRVQGKLTGRSGMQEGAVPVEPNFDITARRQPRPRDWVLHPRVAVQPESRWDLLRVPFVGPILRNKYFRLSMQSVMFFLAAVIVIDGLWGPQITGINLAGVAPWIHWRGLLVIGLLVAGNLFCMACPFTMSRSLAARLFPAKWNWPSSLQSKWLAIGLLVGFFWAYEAFALWDTPWWTAWIVIGYFMASFVIDSLFQGAAFCKYVCPIGQFNFVHSLLSPLQVAVHDEQVCQKCETKDCIRGGQLGRGCAMDLFQPKKSDNMDCTFCLDCVQACPANNVGVLAFFPVSQLSSKSTDRKWFRRPDLAALLVVLSAAAFVNAAWMVGPVIRLEQQLMAYFQVTNRIAFVAIGILLTLVVIPAAVMLLLASLSRWWGGSGRSLMETASRFALALIPLALAMWTAHYTFHLLTRAGTFISAGNRFLSDWGLMTLSDAAYACGCCGSVASWILPLEIILLDIGLCVSLYIAYRIANDVSRSRRQAIKAWVPWAILLLTLFATGIWIFFQPMQMRGTLGI
ncbi:MAG: cytochrome c oxidase assembly protein [Planctomycetales bacterium]